MSWWSRVYERPLKDPLLQSYTFYELVYEYFDRVERDKRTKTKEEEDEEECDRMEEEERDAVELWADEEEAKELEELEKREANNDPRKDPDNVTWMDEQLKEEFGEDSSGDLSIDFEDDDAKGSKE